MGGVLWGAAHPNWKGDAAGDAAKYDRTRRRFAIDGPCEGCGGTATQRHHRDGDVGNIDPSNIALVCHRCHATMDGRLAAFVERMRHRPPKTHCLRGHEFTPENTRFLPKRKERVCLTCSRERQARYKERRRGH